MCYVSLVVSSGGGDVKDRSLEEAALEILGSSFECFRFRAPAIICAGGYFRVALPSPCSLGMILLSLFVYLTGPSLDQLYRSTILDGCASLGVSPEPQRAFHPFMIGIRDLPGCHCGPLIS